MTCLKTVGQATLNSVYPIKLNSTERWQHTEHGITWSNTTAVDNLTFFPLIVLPAIQPIPFPHTFLF